MPNDFRPVTEWPRLLAGPMVRRVANNRAHIFIATKMACKSHIILYNGRQSYSSPAIPIKTAKPVPLNQIGQHLFIGVLAVDIPPPPQISPGSVISYDVIVDDGDARGLFQLGLLGGSEASDPRRAEFPLGYEEGMLPSFILPPAAPSKLQIVHASCRKPHGGGSSEADALQLLDIAISKSIDGTLSADSRPQQLILTGDQIYADDVAPSLLKALMGAGDALLGWEEELPLIGDTSGLDFMVDPGWRTRYLSIRGIDLKEQPKDGATDYSQSHLLRFGEWVAMYLFAWSDALWSIDSHDDYYLPEPPARLPVQQFETALSLADPLGIFLISDRKKRRIFRETLDSVQRAAQVAAWLSEFSDNLERIWDETRSKALRYGKSVRSIRRVLANCSTYTMFDDHEITDDWYVSKRVHDRLKGDGQQSPKSDVGPRLLRNGLSAYAFFQHWGNAPDDFGPGSDGAKGRQLLNMWQFTGTSSGCAMKQTPRGGDTLLGIEPGDSPIPTPDAQGIFSRSDFVRFRWDYAVDFQTHRLIALDTRTWRSFPAGTPFSWTDLAPHTPNAASTAATSGAAEITDIAAAWRQAGLVIGSIAMQNFATVIEEYNGYAAANTENLAQLRSRITNLWIHISEFQVNLPGRVAIPESEREDPISSAIYDFLHDPSNFARVISTWGDSVDELHETVLEHMRDAAEFDFGLFSSDLNSVFEGLAEFVDAAWSGSIVGMVHTANRVAHDAGTDLWTLFTDIPTSSSAFINLEAASVVALNALDTLTTATGLEDLGRAIFRSGDNRLAPGLIREDALPFMVNEPLERFGANTPITFLLSPAPIFGNRLVEMVQRISVVHMTINGTAGEEEMDFEPWTANIPAMIALFEAARSLRCAIVLSGDVHYAGSSVVEVSTAYARTRYIQFTSSAARNSDNLTRSLGRLDDFLYDEAGTVFFEQSDWTSLMDQGQSSLPHLENLAWEAIAQELDNLGNAVNLRNAYEDLRVWWASSSITKDDVVNTVTRAFSAPANTVRALSTEAAWQLYSAIETIEEFSDDPVLKIYGDFLTAPAPLRRHLRQFYAAVGLDGANGLRLTETVLVDRRSPRLTLYPVASRYNADSIAAEVVEAHQRRTVGYANAGFISFVTRDSEIVEVAHELRWYPHDEPEREVINDVRQDPIPRTDWYGTLHRAGWFGFPRDPGRHRP